MNGKPFSTIFYEMGWVRGIFNGCAWLWYLKRLRTPPKKMNYSGDLHDKQWDMIKPFFFWRGVAKNIAIFGGFNPPFSDWQAKAARIPSVETLIASSWLKSSGGESVIQSPYMWEIYRKNLDFLWI